MVPLSCLGGTVCYLASGNHEKRKSKKYNLVPMNNLQLIPVKELVSRQFHISSQYQRGYRWKEQQVNQLLDDLASFAKTAEVKAYFLQVLILSKPQDKYNVVDGQQRLTTINLICDKLGLAQPKLDYDPVAENSSLDKHFKENASRTIDKWLCGHVADKEKLKDNLLEAEFLVYELTDPAAEAEVFSRVNSGKIAAKDSELVKCVMLTPGNDEPLELTKLRAAEWDEMERALNDEAFYSFLTPRNAKDADDRMTRLFVAAGFVPNDADKKNNTFPYLVVIQGEIARSTREKVWQRLAAAYTKLQSWFGDNLYYHAVGWWIHSDRYGDKLNSPNITTVLDDLKKISCKMAEVAADEILYVNNPLGAWNLLFLFNLAYSWSQQNCRYDFAKHRQVAKWSLEHLMARNVRDLEKEEFENFLKFVPSEKQEKYSCASYDEYIKQPENQKDKYLEGMLGEEQYNGDDDHSLGNLALLGGDANSSLNNHLFPQKRCQINKWNSSPNEYFVLPATAAVFNKCFPDMDTTKLFLSKDEKTSYTNFIQQTIENFVKEVSSHVN